MSFILGVAALPLIGGVLSALVFLLFVGVAVICAQRKKQNKLYKTKRYKTSFNLLQSDKKYFPLFNITKKVVILFDLFDTRCL